MGGAPYNAVCIHLFYSIILQANRPTNALDSALLRAVGDVWTHYSGRIAIEPERSRSPRARTEIASSVIIEGWRGQSEEAKAAVENLFTAYENMSGHTMGREELERTLDDNPLR